jgi:very-short-patch-repair endonuclease
MKNIEQIKDILRCKKISIFSNPKNTRDRMELCCNECNYKWTGIYNNYIRGDICVRECPKCRGRVGKLTNDVIDADMKKQGRNIIRIGDCVDSYTPIQWKCLKDGHVWLQKPNSIRNGRGCPKCGNSLSKTNEDIDKKLILDGRKIKRIGDSVGNNKIPIEWECQTCSGKWCAAVNNVVDGGSGCPHCRSNTNEKLFYDILKKRFGETDLIRGYKIVGENISHRCDFYIKSMNIIIEYNGIQHYKPVKHFGGNEKFIKQKKVDEFVREYCIKNNIKLIEVDNRSVSKRKNNIKEFIYGISL